MASQAGVTQTPLVGEENSSGATVLSPAHPETWTQEERSAAADKEIEIYKQYMSAEHTQATDDIHNFKSACESRNVNYVDAFLTGNMTAEEYKKVDGARRVLMLFWKDVRKLYKARKLTADGGDFFSPKKRWLRQGNEYRILVEPLDIANWYKASHHLKGSGHYFDTVGEGEDGLRPSQYAFLDRLMKEANGNYVYSLAKAEEYKRQAMQGTLQIHKLEDARGVPPRGFQRVPALVVPDGGQTGSGPKNLATTPTGTLELSELQTPRRAQDSWPHDIFISHAGPVKGLAQDLENDLHGLGFNAFVDKIALHPGDKADDKMVDSAKRAPIGLVLFDEHFVLREWPMAELKLIVEADTLLPIIIGMSHTEFKEAWRASQVASQYDDAFFARVTRTTFIVDKGGWQGDLRQRICFAVTRMFVEGVCPRLPNTMRAMGHVLRAAKAAKAITSFTFRDLTVRDIVDAQDWVRQLETVINGKPNLFGDGQS